MTHENIGVTNERTDILQWKTYERTLSLPSGEVGITLNLQWSFPATSSPEDLAAQDRNLQFKFGWFAHPIFVNGDYPDVMKTKIAEKSRALNRTSSRLPEFTQAEKIANKGKSRTI